MEHVNILVFPCGTEVGLEIQKALGDISFINLIGASSVPDHGAYVYKNYTEEIPFVTDSLFLEKVNQVVRKYGIEYIFPAHDSAVLALSEGRDQIEAKILTSSKETVRICRDKQQTYEFLAGEPFLPQVYNDVCEVKQFPVIIKPAVGQGAKGFMVIDTQHQLEQELLVRKEQHVICEYLPGEEYTIDCFTDRHGSLLYAGFRNRLRIRNGISVCSELQPVNEEILTIARRLNELMKFRGAWFFQVKKNDKEEFRLLEVATRIAGTMCVDRAIGVNLPLLTVFDAMGHDVSVVTECDYVRVDRALNNKYYLGFYYDEVYVDFDDTIIVHGQVNTEMMQFLYQCVNKNIPLHLLTRHQGDIYSSLKKHRISEKLFTSIIHVKPECKKVDFVEPSPNALFIDDSFAERKAMRERFSIKTLGVDAVEALLDWRK